MKADTEVHHTLTTARNVAICKENTTIKLRTNPSFYKITFVKIEF